MRSTVGGTLDALVSHADHSWMDSLLADPESDKFKPNKSSRQVRSGHYVPVLPTKLPDPYLVSYSNSMAHELGIDDNECNSVRFAAFFSGDQAKVPGFRSWCTPYALSIYGQELYEQCPFGKH